MSRSPSRLPSRSYNSVTDFQKSHHQVQFLEMMVVVDGLSKNLEVHQLGNFLKI